MDIFVGSLPFKLKESQLKETFEAYGEVTSVKIIIDKITRQNKGFGFVEMPNDGEANRAIKALNGSEMDGRKIIVNQSEGKQNTGRKNSNSGGNSKRGGYDKGDNRRK
jgi:RNA recognition motif-containing protein